MNLQIWGKSHEVFEVAGLQTTLYIFKEFFGLRNKHYLDGENACYPDCTSYAFQAERCNFCVITVLQTDTECSQEWGPCQLQYETHMHRNKFASPCFALLFPTFLLENLLDRYARDCLVRQSIFAGTQLWPFPFLHQRTATNNCQ